MIDQAISKLLAYGLQEGILNPKDQEYATNQLLYLLQKPSFEYIEPEEEIIDFFEVMDVLLEDAISRGLIEDELTQKDHFEAKLVDCLMPRPSQIDERFRQLYKKAPRYATDDFYTFSKKTNYIKTRRIALNQQFEYEGKYAPLQISINLSKPEKDPLKIKHENALTQTDYPKCALCMENVGFYGNDKIASRSNHRVITLTINHEKDAWGFQYSPYSYFNEHCIVLKKEHIPMKVDSTTFAELIDFVNQFPHYLMGSNAGLPIVGGSILSHYHFQGGRAEFPIEKANVLKTYKEGKIEIDVLDWPVSTILVKGNNENKLLDMVNRIVDRWKTFDNEEIGLLSKTTEEHNTVTPIVKINGANYYFYLVLRNNRTTETRPYGLFHPQEKYFHIKKENIGLIEVMGLAILPGRLDKELALIESVLLGNQQLDDLKELKAHREWVEELRLRKPDETPLTPWLQQEVGHVFEAVLEDCGVFKRNQQKEFLTFVEKAIR